MRVAHAADIHPALQRRVLAMDQTVNNIDLAEHLAAVALCNLARVTESAEPNEVVLLTWPELSESQRIVWSHKARVAARRGQ